MTAEIIDAIRTLGASDPRLRPVTDPEVIRAIEADFRAAVREAAQVATRRYLGLDEAPKAVPA